MVKKTFKRSPIAYSGDGSAVDNYFAPKEQQKFGSASDWAKFNSKNSQHMHILALARNAQWEKTHPRHGTVADLERIGHWLQTKAPVKKPLMDMSPTELSKTIKAMDGVVLSIFK